MSYCDIRGAMSEVIGEHTPEQNHAAVCAVLRWARRAHVGVVEAALICSVLGLDLTAALNRDEVNHE